MLKNHEFGQNKFYSERKICKETIEHHQNESDLGQNDIEKSWIWSK